MKREWSIIQVDAVEALRAMPEESVDLLFTDPAYESIEKHRKGGPTVRLKTWFQTFPDHRLGELAEACWRVLKKHRHLYMFCDDTTSDILKPALQRAGFRVWKRLVWDKVDRGTGYHYATRYEFILFAEKGRRALNTKRLTDVLTHKKVYNGYPSEKPVQLCIDIIGNSTTPGELVCDPFCGSAAIGEAALMMGCKYIGYDIAGDAVELAKERLGGV